MQGEEDPVTSKTMQVFELLGLYFYLVFPEHHVCHHAEQIFSWSCSRNVFSAQDKITLATPLTILTLQVVGFVNKIFHLTHSLLKLALTIFHFTDFIISIGKTFLKNLYFRMMGSE